jgi:hypothetical protein
VTTLLVSDRNAAIAYTAAACGSAPPHAVTMRAGTQLQSIFANVCS